MIRPCRATLVGARLMRHCVIGSTAAGLITSVSSRRILVEKPSMWNLSEIPMGVLRLTGHSSRGEVTNEWLNFHEEKLRKAIAHFTRDERRRELTPDGLACWRRGAAFTRRAQEGCDRYRADTHHRIVIDSGGDRTIHVKRFESPTSSDSPAGLRPVRATAGQDPGAVDVMGPSSGGTAPVSRSQGQTKRKSSVV